MVNHSKLTVQHVDARLGDHDAVAERRVPVDAADVRHAQLIDNALGAEIVEEKSVVGGDEDFAQGRRVDHIDLGQAFFDDGPLAGVGAVEAGDKDLARIAVKRADTVLADEDAGKGVLSSFLKSASRLCQIFVEGEQDELSTLNVEVENEIVTSLIEAIVVDLCRLIQQNLLSSGLNRRHHLLVTCRQVIQIELLLLDEEEGGADTDAGVPLTLQLEHVHALIVTRREVVERRVRSHDPVPICVLASCVDGESTLHVPEAHRTILRV